MKTFVVVCLTALMVLTICRTSLAAKRVDVKKRMATMMIHYNSPLGKRELNGNKPTLKHMLGLKNGENLKKANSMKTAQGTKKSKYKETYEGLEVHGEGVVVETYADGTLSGDVEGQLVEDIKKDVQSVTPGLSKDDAYNIALAKEDVDISAASFDKDADIKLMVYIDGAKHEDNEVKANLAYILSFLTETKEGGMSRPFYVIDANSGKVIKHWSGLTTHPTVHHISGIHVDEVMDKGSPFKLRGDGGNINAGRHIYGKDYASLLVTKINEKCYMVNDKVQVLQFNLCSKTRVRPNVNSTHSFGCFEGNYDFTNGAFSPSNDAYFYSVATYDMFKKWYGTAPLNFKIKVVVHYANYPNAFWNGRYVTFLDGGRNWFPLTTAGIVGHEIAHGFTEHNSGLIYRGQSGGINEAFSDMSGEAVEYFLKGKTDFQVGAGVRKHSPEPLRYMDDPRKDNRSLISADDYCGNINVHYSSGVFNHAFYLLANKPGWNPRKAFHPFVVANQLYWRESSNFNDAACGVKNAAKDLGYDVGDVVEVFRSVGVLPCFILPEDSDRNGVGKLSVKGKGQLFFKWYVLAGMKSARIILAGTKGSAHMVVKYGSRPKIEKFDFSSVNTGNDQIVEFPNPKEGYYYIMVYTNTGFTNARLDVSHKHTGLSKKFTSDMLKHSKNVTFRGITWLQKFYELDALPKADYLVVNAKKDNATIFMAIWEGTYNSRITHQIPVSFGRNSARLCKIESKKYVVVFAYKASDESVKTDACETEAVGPLLRYRFGTKLKAENIVLGKEMSFDKLFT